MSVHFWLRSAAVRRRAIAWRFRPIPVSAACALLISGCAAQPPQGFQGPDASDPAAAVPAARNRSTIEPYASYRPADPASWRKRNERVTPAPKQGEK